MATVTENITIEAIESRMNHETEWARLQAEREAIAEPIAKLTRQYSRGLMTRREYFEELYYALEDMGAPVIIK